MIGVMLMMSVVDIAFLEISMVMFVVGGSKGVKNSGI